MVPVTVVVNQTVPSAAVDLSDKDLQEETHYVKFTVSFYEIREVTLDGGILLKKLL